MRITWIYVILAATMVLARPKEPSSTSSEHTSDDLISDSTDDSGSEYVEADEEDSDKEALPVLPPIILLDFGDNDNSSSSSDEKSKRNIDGSLGYGYLKNNLFSGKYNYYFPGGPTGTTVSIEESISPFEPKTIIENSKPVTERPLDATNNNYKNFQPKAPTNLANQPNAQPWTASFPPTQQVFGQRTKLRKYNPSDYPRGYSTTVKPNIIYTTVRPDLANNNQNLNDFTTVKSVYSSQYSTTPSYPDTYVAGLNPPEASFPSLTTSNPLSDDPTLFNIPRYTVENGIRYENKIVWKYPDGRLANPPATSYINTYSQFSGPHQTKINHQSTFQNAYNHPNTQNIPSNHRYPSESFRPNSGFKNPVYQESNSRYHTDQKQNIYSQKPAQFPSDQESFSSRPGGNPQSSAFDLSYQSNYGFRQKENMKGSNRYEQSRPLSKYAVNSANAEYSFPQNNPIETTTAPNLFTQSGQLSSQVLSKYTPQAQKYLSKVFTNMKDKESVGSSADPNAFIQKNYANLLNYNPSISQYIKDPSSILQATPTFIQAGDSLVPVIILRIDGARPVAPPTPNINLKALLQQYLSQYAGNTETENRDYSNDNINTNINNNNAAADGSSKFSPIEDLTYLTQALKRFSPNANNRNIPTSNAAGNLGVQSIANLPLEYETAKYNSQKTSYDTLKTTESRFNNRDQHLKYPSSIYKPKQKVKSVQIIEDSSSSSSSSSS